MKKLVAVSTACLVVIASVMLYNTWSEYRRRREIEAALAAPPPPRFKTSVPPAGATPDPSSQIVISVDDEGRLRLNDREAGTTADLAPLRTQLESMLNEREGRDGGVRPDRTVWVKASSKLKYRELAKVVDAAKAAGAYPVGLRVDDEQ
jgi:biopolymer transport protein ExbD